MARGAFNERVFRTVALPLIVRAANLGWHVGDPLFYAPVVSGLNNQGSLVFFCAFVKLVLYPANFSPRTRHVSTRFS